MKKNNYKKSPRNLKPLVLVIFLLIIIGVCSKFAIQFLKSSEIFIIKKISFPKTIVFQKDSCVFDFIGENLFSLNLKKVERRIRLESPQLTKVRLLRHLPDELVIEASKRSPIALVNLSGKYFYVDSDCAISSSDIQLSGLPVILGVVNRPGSLRVGQLYDDRNLRFGLEIIQEIDKITYLKKMSLAKVNVANLSRTSVVFGNGIEVIIGEERLGEKLQLLVLVVSRLENELNQVKYIDLRFKEPVIGRK